MTDPTPHVLKDEVMLTNWRSCGTGNCPHESVQDCLDAVSKALAGEIARSQILIEAAELVLKHVSPRDKEVYPSFQKLEDALKNLLTADDR